MELPKEIKDAINSTLIVSQEVEQLLQAKDDREMLMIAHKIRAKMEIKSQIGFDIEKALLEAEKK